MNSFERQEEKNYKAVSFSKIRKHTWAVLGGSQARLNQGQNCFPMRIFQSVSAHSSEISIANHPSRPTVSQLKRLSAPTVYQTDLRIINHRRQKFPPSQTLLSFKTRINWPLGWPQTQVNFRGYFFNSCNIERNVQAFWLTGLLWWQKLTWLFQHFLKDCRFPGFRSSIFCFRCKFSFHDRGTLDQVWQWRQFYGPISILCYA